MAIYPHLERRRPRHLHPEGSQVRVREAAMSGPKLPGGGFLFQTPSSPQLERHDVQREPGIFDNFYLGVIEI